MQTHNLYWTEEVCYNKAKECSTIKEFSSKYNYAYIKSLKKGWYKSYVWLKRETPYNLTEPIYLIYAYEDDENLTCYVGLTKNLIKRKSSHKKREFYRSVDGVVYKTYDTVKQYFVDLNKDLPNPKVLEEKLNAIEAQDRERAWCDFYIKNGWVLLNKAKTGVGHSSIGGYPQKWTDDALIDLASKFQFPEQLKKKHSWAYKCIRTRGLMLKCFPQYVEDLPNEIWKDIPEFEGKFQISNLMRVKRLTQGKYRGERLMSIYYKHGNPNNPYVQLSCKHYKLNQLMADIFGSDYNFS